MSRLRAENEEEEQKLAAVSNGDGGDGSGNGNEITGKNQILEVDEEDLEGMDEEEQMRKRQLSVVWNTESGWESGLGQ